MKRLKYSRSIALDSDARCSFAECDMRDAERACVAAKAREPREQIGVGRAREQRGEERVFLRAREIELVDIRVGLFAIEIGPQAHARNAGRRLDGEYALGGNFVPVRHGRLRDADTAGELGNPTDRLDRCAQSRITHRENRSEVSPHPHENRSKG